MCFEVLRPMLRTEGVEVGLLVSVLNQGLLCLRVRNSDALCLSVRVHTRLSDYGLDVISVCKGTTKSLDEQGCDAFAPGIAISFGIPHPGMPTRAEHV